MIKNLTYTEAMQVEVSGDPLTLKDIKHARKGAREYSGSWIVVMLTKTGARLEVSAKGRGFRWRLNGYATDGSDVGIEPRPKPPPAPVPVVEEKEAHYGGLWGLWTEDGLGHWATAPFENPLKDFLLFDSKGAAEKYIKEHTLLYGSYVPKPKTT